MSHKPNPNPIFDSLTDEEKKTLADCERTCKEFILAAGEWGQDNTFSMEEFCDEFPPLFDESILVATLENYMREVESMADTLHGFFPLES